MKLLPFRFEPEGEYVEIVVAGDLHIGSPQFNSKKAKAHRKYCLDSPDRYLVDVGDGCENALKDSPGGPYEQTDRPQSQVDIAEKYYKGLPLLAIAESNHAERSVRAADYSYTRYLCKVLGCEYVRYIGALAVTVGNSAKGHTYMVAFRHFAGNASTPEGIQRQLRAKSQFLHGFDVHCAGHSHCYTKGSTINYLPDPRHNKMKQIETYYSTCSSFMDWDESYGEGRSYDPPVFGMVSIKLYRDKRKVEVDRLVYD
jgi:hypothetical protein